MRMLKKNSFDSSQIMFRSDELMKAASNRYKITVAVAKRAKQRRKEDFDNIEEVMKPVLRAIIEMSDELTQPEIISDD
jgi:DNA-directed RNA polymerase subunit omega